MPSTAVGTPSSPRIVVALHKFYKSLCGESSDCYLGHKIEIKIVYSCTLPACLIYGLFIAFVAFSVRF